MARGEAGHTFLARMGKTRLRPGGRRATEWLLSGAGMTADSRVLEVACNMGTTSIEVARRFGCRVTGLDRDAATLDAARANAARAGMADRIAFVAGNALDLDVDADGFDVVINEAMLTMYANLAKPRLVAGYRRVLKPGGRLLTHDVMLTDDAPPEVVEQMRAAINVQAEPMTEGGWRGLFADAGFSEIRLLTGPMSLLSPAGLIADEGLRGTLRILRNALRTENRATFATMFRTFRRHRRHLRFVAAICTK